MGSVFADSGIGVSGLLDPMTAKLWSMIAVLVANLSSPLAMPEGDADPFSDATYTNTSASSNYVIGGGFLAPTETAGSPGGGNWGDNIIPTMTAETTAGWSITSPEASYTTNLPWKVGDGDSGTRWNAQALPCNLVMQAPSAQTVMGYYLKTAGSGTNYNPTAWVVYGSANGTDWTAVDSRSGQSLADGEGRSYKFSAPVSYIYFKLRVTACVSSTTECLIATFKLHGVRTNILPAAAANSIDGYTFSASSEASSTYAAWKAADGTAKTASNGWLPSGTLSTSDYWQVLFSQSTPIAAVQVAPYEGGNNSTLTSFTVQALISGTWTTVATVSGASATLLNPKWAEFTEVTCDGIRITAMSGTNSMSGLSEVRVCSSRGNPLPVLAANTDADSTVSLSMSNVSGSLYPYLAIDGSDTTYAQFGTAQANNYWQASFATARTVRALTLMHVGSCPSQIRVWGSNDSSFASYTVCYSTDSAGLTADTRKSFLFSTTGSFRYYRIVYVDATTTWAIKSVEFVADALPASAATVNAMTHQAINLSVSSGEAARVIFRASNEDATGQIDLGNSGSNRVELRVSIDGGSTFTALDNFTVENLGSNIYRYTSPEFSIGGATVVIVQFRTYARATVCPRLKIYDRFSIWRNAA